ncbi:HNH endonuclease signature motif containing protein [Corynebacterium lipophiloflavum]|nr:HNH endonuclease signature motif containing protein [Corynebacterium lipophiloflavum]
MEFPLLTASFRAGVLSYSTVRYLLRYLTPETEADLVKLAEKLCFAELKRALAGVEKQEDQAEGPKYHHDVRIDDNGDVVVSARLNAADGAAYMAALKIAQLAHYGLDTLDDEDDEEAIDAELERHRRQPEAHPATECPPERPRNISEHFTGAFSRVGPPTMDDMYAALLAMVHMVRSNPVSELRTPGAHVNIMMTTNGRAWLPGNVAAPSKVLESYVDNALVRLQMLDKNGLTLHLGRQSRFVNNAQFRALLAVWGYECAMPGCNHTRFLQVHHIKEWANGGETNLENLIPLCSACHSRVTNGLAHITTNGRTIEFRFRGGRRFVSHGGGLPEKSTPFTGPVVLEAAENRIGHPRGSDFND